MADEQGKLASGLLAELNCGPNKASESRKKEPPMSTRWPYFRPLWQQLEQVSVEMNRLFERWNESGLTVEHNTNYPAVDIWEEGDAIVVEAELPGLDLESLHIYVTGPSQLSLEGERRAPQMDTATWHCQERRTGAFNRVINLPLAVDRDRVEARLERGILRVRLAKHEAAQRRKIEIRSE
jgi:HSP20 family protein